MPTDDQIQAIIKAAQECPESHRTPLDESPEVKELSRLLVEAGYPGLSRAVVHGARWSGTVASQRNAQQMAAQETQAAMPGWTWNPE
ncbi:MAG: hypothetical protein ABJZ55_13215 [Fuerstiella sp.]